MLTINLSKIRTLLAPSSFARNLAYFHSEFKSKSNPFHLKSLQELQKMLQSTLTQKTNSNVHGLLLLAITDKVLARDRKFQEKRRQLDENAIVNKCLSLTLSSIEDIDIKGLLYITEVFQRLQDEKNIRLQEINYRVFIEKFPIKLNDFLNENTVRQNMQDLNQILFNLIKIRRKGIILNKLIYFIVNNGLNNKTEIIQFLKKLLEFNQFRNYQFKSIEKLIKRYIQYLDLRNQSRTTQVQDYNPIILETIQSSGLIFKPFYYTVVKEYVYWLERQIKKSASNLSIWTKIKMMEEIINYFYNLPGHLIEWENIREHFEFIEWLFLNIHEDMKKIEKLDLMEMQNIIKAIFSYKNLNHNDLWSMKGASIDFKKNARMMSNTLALKLIETIGQYKNDEIVSLINDIGFSGLTFDQEISDKLVELSINFLESLSFKKLLLPTIRIFEFITYNILESKSDKYIPKMKELLKKVEKTVKNLTYYEMLRLHAIIMNLNIEVLQIKQFFQFKNSNNQAQTVENLSRTILKKYSLPQIKQICENSIKKYQKNKDLSKHDFSKCDIISVSLRGSKLQNDNQNDEMFKFWFHTHWDFTRSVFKKQEPVHYIIKFINKELLRSYFFNTLKSELQIESFFIYRSQIQDKSSLQDVEKKFEEYLKPLLKLQKLRESTTSKRYSFLPKLVWLYQIILEKIGEQKEQYRFQSILKQMLFLSRRQKSLDTSSFHCLEKRLILELIKSRIEYLGDNMSPLILQLWFWATRNDLLDDSSFFKENHHAIFNHCININKKTASAYQIVEFLLGNSHMQKVYLDLIDEVNSEWAWYSFLRGSASDVKIEDVITLLGFKNIIRYLTEKNENFIQLLLNRMIEIEYFVGYIKYLQIWKIFEEHESKVSNEVKEKVNKWLERQLSMLKEINLSRYSEVFIKTKHYTKVEIIPKQIEEYLSENLKNGNFYQITQYIELSKSCQVQDVEALLDSVIINRPLLYLLEAFPVFCFDIIDSLFSLVLFKEDKALLHQFTKNYLGFLDNMSLEEISREKKYGFLMKLKVASCALDQDFLWISHNRISKDFQINDEKISNYIHQKQLQIIISKGQEHFLKTFMYQRTKIFNLSLLMNKKKYVILSDNRSKQSKIEEMYLQKYHHMTEIESLCCEEYVRLHELSKVL